MAAGPVGGVRRARPAGAGVAGALRRVRLYLEAGQGIALDGAVKSVNRELEQNARDLAGLKGYVTNLATCPDGTPVTPEFVIGSYHELWNIEKSFHVAKHDLRARPVYHRMRDSIEALCRAKNHT